MAAQRPRLHLSDTTIQAITQQVAATGGNEDQRGPNLWAQYMLLLCAASRALDHAPASVQECLTLDIEERLADDLGQLALALHELLPGGLMEIADYLPEALRHGKWARDLRWS